MRQSGVGRSLSLRVALIAAGGTALALLVAGAIFLTQFTAAVERNFDGRLETLLLTLITATDADGNVDENAVEGSSGGSFSRPLSGWYWQSRDGKTGQLIDWSESLRFDLLPVKDLPSAAEPARTFTFRASGGRQLRALEQLVTLGGDRTFALLVAGDTEPMMEDIDDFRSSVVRLLGGLAILLAIGLAVLLRWGLRPLRRVSDDLARVRDGKLQHLAGFYPTEIEPLVQDLNALIESNREIVERARTHVGNLAHALKTPIAVLQNEIATAAVPEAVASRFGEQIAIMRDQVGHHLNRARIAAQTNVIGALTAVAPVLAGIDRVMRKVHQDRGLAIEIAVSPDLRFRGEKHDLEEMAGNLFDNACKWARSQVRITARRQVADRNHNLLLLFEDDGPGLPEDRRENALSRGTRLDETKPGSGLGLAIVVELARVYGGDLTMERSELGGLAAQLTLPAQGE